MHCNSLTISTRASSRLTFSQQYNEAYRHHSSTTESQGKDKHVGIERSKINSGPRLSVAVVGAGPSGFYAAKYLTSSVLKRIQQVTQTTLAAGVGTDANDTRSTESEHEPSSVSSSPFAWFGIDVDIIERLPTPYGLVRYGVAPDHPEVKNVEKDFASLFANDGDVSSHDRQRLRNEEYCDDIPISTISYFGNVTVGKDISLSKLQSLYHIVILAYGCQSDKRLGIPGESTLEGVLSAREFVAWYNGHPEYGHVGSIVERCLWSQPPTTQGDDDGGSCDERLISPARVVVIGQGNVALDCARILAKGKPGLMDTDTPSNVLDVLRGGVSHVSVVGRRGHVQGAFTIKVSHGRDVISL